MPKINYLNLNEISIINSDANNTANTVAVTSLDDSHNSSSHYDTTDNSIIIANNYIDNNNHETNSCNSVDSSSTTHGTIITTNSNAAYSLNYANAYKLSFSLEQNLRENIFLLPNESINIEIIGHEEEQSILLQTKVYTINVKHGNSSWVIKRRYKNFLKLYEEFALFKTKYNLRHASDSVNVYNSKFKPKDHFQLFFASFANDFNKARYILEKFLNDVVQHSIFRYHNETLKFFEISHLSFISELGDKMKEGIIKKRSGGYKVNIGCCSTFNCSLCWDKRWLIVKDSWVGYLHPNTGEIRAVLLVDHGFSVYSGLEDTNYKGGLVIENLSRYLHTKCYNEKRSHEWRAAIMDMLNKECGKLFHKPMRFNSYAPIRDDSVARWFIGGCDYMEAIADAIEMAKEEIFIAGFFISPEIYLKRPVITGDKYRLDKMLKRKAEEGVKVYILMYKEIEMALSINSAYTKRIFTLANENIKVLRHPDHMKDQLHSILWAHHEKLLIIDQSIAFLGGVDLCYGRWDTYHHKLVDLGSVLQPQTTTPIKRISSETRICDNKNFVKQNELSAIMEPIEQESKSFFNKNTYENKIDMEEDEEINTGTHDFSHIEPKSERKSNLFAITNERLMRMNSVHPSDNNNNVYQNENAKNNENILDDYYLNDNNEMPAVAARTSSIAADSDNKKSSFSMRVDGAAYRKLKRSKSLEISDYNKKIGDETDSLYKVRFNNRLKNFKQTLNTKIKTNPILSTINRENIDKKVKEFKESIKRYTLQQRTNNCDTNSEIDYQDKYQIDENDDLDNECEKTDKCEDHVDMGLQGSSKLWFGKDYTNFIVKDFDQLDLPYKDLIDRSVMHRMPWHDISCCAYGSVARDAARHFIQRWNYIKMKKVRNNTNFPLLLPKTYESKNYEFKIPKYILRNHEFKNCRIQCLRSVCNWSAGLSATESSIHEALKYLIKKAKHYIYIENQFFISIINNNDSNASAVRNEIAQCLYERILQAHKNNEKFKVFVFVPLIPGYEGEYGRASGITLQTITHYNNLSINNLYKKLNESSIRPHDYICFFSLRTWSELNGNLITELIYVHSKLMIIDDTECIIGSANINDRSLLGTRDSEFALHIEDLDLTEGFFNNQPTKIGKFCSTLRKNLFKEFLGEFHIKDVKNSKYFNINDNLNILCPSTNTFLDLTDPCTDEFYENILFKYAKLNTSIYKNVFNTIPCDSISNFEQLKEVKRQKPLNLTNHSKAIEEVKKIKGYIVLYPNLFLCNENLTPSLLSKEKYFPTSLWI